MKTKITSGSVRGHIIVLTLVASLVLGVVLVSVVSLTSSENRMTRRSEGWHGAMPLVEARIEEALTRVRYAATNRDANGWTFADHDYTKRRQLSDAFYQVTI